MLRTGELAAIRRAAEKWLPSTCTIRVHSSTIDDGGGIVETYTAGASVACRLAPVDGGEGSRGGRVSDRTTHMLTLPAETVVEETAQVDCAGQRYEVTAVRKRPALEATRRVEVREAG